MSTANDVLKRSNRLGVEVRRHFTDPRKPVDETVEWEKRSARLSGADGTAVFLQEDVEVPSQWSQMATNIVASKYFRGHQGSQDREVSVRQLIGRVVDTITAWGDSDGYFASEADCESFRAELTYLLLHQRFAFNSPVWFNVGTNGLEAVQCSACFINSVEDSMDSIMELAKTEARLFKGGSGTGTNLSPVRSSKEGLTGGGIASGPVSFMRGFDAFAGVIRSGGKTRRAAKMVILNVDHPDILEFIRCKSREEKKALSLIQAGYGTGIDGEAYSSVFFQNANHSIRVSDAFMQAALEGAPWHTRMVTTGRVADTYEAHELLLEIAQAAHASGDPGLQFDDACNAWNPVKASGRFHATNPCSEFSFLDDTACNLGSLNLLTFFGPNGFDTYGFEHAVDIAILAQEVLVDRASYPTEKIESRSHQFRPLGLGFANLGALLMSMGLAYDSEAGRSMAAGITALMCGRAYQQSAVIAETRGPFSEYRENATHFEDVIGMHRKALEPLTEVTHAPFTQKVIAAAQVAWTTAARLGQQHGYRNAQVTVLAPTGTIAFMMDCDTTGIEPDLALVKRKQLVGGGQLEIANQAVPRALAALGYEQDAIDRIVGHIKSTGSIEGAEGFATAHEAVFECALPSPSGRTISANGHIAMMAAVQPFLSGAISKTVNLPSSATVQDIFDVYVTAWQLGLKALAVYRDGCKSAQPLSAADNKASDTEAGLQTSATNQPVRQKLPPERAALTHRFAIAGHEGYITVGLYEDGRPGEVFITMSKEGSTISGLMDTLATAVSMALQYGVPLAVLVDKFSHMRFEPSGFTGNPELPLAKSIVDYIFRWLGLRFGGASDHIDNTVSQLWEQASAAVGAVDGQLNLLERPKRDSEDASTCHLCGSLMVRSGSCYACPTCGTTSGCS